MWHNNLGLVAKHRREIKSGTDFNRFFDKPIGKSVIINPSASVYDTVAAMKAKVYRTLSQTKAITSHLLKQSADTENFLKRVFEFAFNHIQYKEDAKGLEQIRTPNVTWAQRSIGVDCDDFTIFCSSILVNAGIPHFMRICEINGKGYFQHVYIVVPKRKNADMSAYSGQYWTVDPVLENFNQEAQLITKIHDTFMSIPLQSLSGGDLGRSPMRKKASKPASNNAKKPIAPKLVQSKKPSASPATSTPNNRSSVVQKNPTKKPIAPRMIKQPKAAIKPVNAQTVVTPKGEVKKVITPASAEDNNRLTLQTLKPIQDGLKQMRADLERNPQAYRGIYNVDRLKKGIDVALKNWENQAERSAALEMLSQQDDTFFSDNYKNTIVQLSGIYGLDDLSIEQELLGVGDEFDELNEVFQLKGDVDGLGNLGKPRLFSNVKAAAQKAAQGVKKVTNTAFEKGIKPAAKATATGVKVGAQAVKKAATFTAKKVGQGAKAAAKVGAKVTLVVPRTAFRGLVAINFRGMATAMKRAIDTKQDAQLKKRWTSLPIAGNWGDLISAINSGAKKKPIWPSKAAKGLKGFVTSDGLVVDIEQFSGLGEPTTIAASIAAAVPIITMIEPLIKKLMPNPPAGAETTLPSGNELPTTDTPGTNSISDNEDMPGTNNVSDGAKSSSNKLLIGGLLAAAAVTTIAVVASNKPKTNLKGPDEKAKSNYKPKTKKSAKLKV